jgi:hypothetical protein
MIQAHLICCEPVDIPDLGLKLKRGEEVWLDDLVARNSSDLRRAQSTGKVRVSRSNRRYAKPPRVLPASHTQPKPKPRVYAKPEPEIIERTVIEERIVEKVVTADVDTDEIATKIRAQMLGDLREVVAQEVSKMMTPQAPQEAPEAAPSQAPAMDAEQMATVMEAAMKRVLASQGGGVVVTSGSSSARKTPGPEEPLYMPSNLVNKDAKAAISVKTETSKTGDELDDATAALRALKKKKKQLGTDGKEEP